jgi:hypothetical protein
MGGRLIAAEPLDYGAVGPHDLAGYRGGGASGVCRDYRADRSGASSLVESPDRSRRASVHLDLARGNGPLNRAVDGCRRSRR